MTRFLILQPMILFYMKIKADQFDHEHLALKYLGPVEFMSKK